uniref:Peptidase, M24 family n=1 Tax=Chlamydia pneumoniae TaxID=83558 RepID=A0A0F7WTK8_CHLPN|nr:Peptidase, M24 family [Chlamydia pneumoniae]
MLWKDNHMSHDRILRAQRALSEHNLDAILVEKSEDLAYFLHDEAIAGILLIGQQEVMFFVYRMDKDLYSHIQRVPLTFLTQDVVADLSLYVQKQRYQKIGFDSASTVYHKFAQRQVLPCLWEPLECFTEKIRSIKSEEEIRRMQEAAALGSAGYDYVLTLLREGITEKEVVRQLRAFWAEAGAEGPSFPPIIAFGEHSAFPHSIPTDRPLKKGDIVLIDIGVLLNGYCSDMTRMTALGTPHPKLLESYPVVVEAQKRAMALCKEGVLWGDIDAEAVRVLREHHLDTYFIHGIGHGVGRNIHEYPCSPRGSQVKLESGMTITVEPGVYFPGIGGIRIEDTLCIDKNKNFSLTARPVISELVCL